MKNQDLISGENIKTHLEIRYVSPIVSESYIPQINKFTIFEGRTHISDGQFENDLEYPCNAQTYDAVYDPFVYDPRFTGYCDDEWRAYENEGRVNYFYGDVDALTKPTYIVRTNLLENAKNQAEKDFLNGQLIQRMEMQQAWLKRRESDRYQQKLFPIHTLGNKLN